MSRVPTPPVPRPPSLGGASGPSLANPELHAKLMAACNKGVFHGGLRLKAAGEPMVGRYLVDPVSGGKRLKIVQYGEYYQLNCPRCGDTRHRMSVSHRWGVYDPVAKSRNLGLIKCYNEDCWKVQGAALELWEQLEFLGMRAVSPHALAPIRTAATTEALTRGVPIGSTIPLAELSDAHPAHVFCRSRGLDPIAMSTNFGAAFCVHSEVKSAIGRLVLPIVFEGRIVGWQARYLGDASKAQCNNALCRATVDTIPENKQCPHCVFGTLRKPVKWLTSEGLSVGRVLFNYDVARTSPYIVITEGPLDVVAMGHPDLGSCVPGPCVAAFNHKLADGQQRLLLPWCATNATVYLVFDGDVDASTEGQRLKLAPYFPGGLIHVKLPDRKDPGDIGPACWALVRKAGLDAGAKAVPDGRYARG